MANPMGSADTMVRPYKNLLIEIGCEELPPKNLHKLQITFVEHFRKMLNAADLTFTKTESFATPRRLALRISDLSLQQPSRQTTKRGPAKNAAFDETGKPTKAALGFAESCGVSIDALSLQETDKGSWLVFEKNEPGKATEQLIPDLLTEALNALPFGRRMRWGTQTDSFVRPIHWIVLLWDHKVIQTEIFGVKSSNLTYGHRFHHPEALPISDPKDYESVLNKGFVIANFEKRREKILSEITRITTEKKINAIIEDTLLDEVTGLVEWPVVLLGSFDKAFLDVPREALITSMQTHQRCFPVEDQSQKLLPHFLLVSNINSKNPAAVVNGNECVIAARLADAVFYYRIDKEIPLHQRLIDLKQVRFQWGLGTLWDKSERLAKLAMLIAPKIHADPLYTERAGLLCKTDLLTQMVGEFPELQSIMGCYYALHDSEPVAVAMAIEDHAHPRFAQDTLPTTPEGAALALADRLDSLVGIFGLGNRPTGDKDPFALRRQALGILRILIEKQCDCDLNDLLHVAKEQYAHQAITLSEPEVISQVLDFCFERLRALYQDKGINPRVFEAVFAKRITNILDFDKRIQAINYFITLKEAESLAAANKRVQNILSKCDTDIFRDLTVQNDLLTENAEKTLWLQLAAKEKEVAPLLQVGNYTEALKSLATLREPIDQFFTDVMVMVDDLTLRNNRLRLLHRLRVLFLEIADISLL
ncbi:MAG TPA: glycine--tRNA ligase subunit beta [Gammaproteobacteria bacterium]|nr:glycine--tRNA ligase subunit beta [Gammaproteobacteria bacterium]